MPVRGTSRSMRGVLSAVAVLLMGLMLGGCAGSSTGTGAGTSSAGTSSAGTSSAGSASAPAATVAPRIPDDGVSLQQLGYRFGPVAELSLPRTSVVTAMVDQDNNVTAALSSPSADAVAAYLRRALPLAGFTITADNHNATTPALTFTGHAWHGSFTGDDQAAALLVRPGAA